MKIRMNHNGGMSEGEMLLLNCREPLYPQEYENEQATTLSDVDFEPDLQFDTV